jgi:hypothetical protein
VFGPDPERVGPTQSNPPHRPHRRRLHPVDENDAMTLTRSSLRVCRGPRVEFILEIAPIVLDQRLFLDAPGRQRSAAPTCSPDRERATDAPSGKDLLHQQMNY